MGQPVVLERLGKLRSWYATVFNHRMPVQYVQSATIERPNAVAVRRYVSCKIALSMENERKLWMIASGTTEVTIRSGESPECIWTVLKNSADKVTIEIVCGTCGTGQSKPIGYFRNHSHLICDGCGSEITIENEKFRASIAEFGRTMARLREPYLH